MRKEVAYTEPGSLPAFVNFSTEGDMVTVTVREAAREFDGVAVCGVDCQPGDGVCNNYCGRLKGERARRSPPKTHRRAGKQVQMTLPKAEFEAMARQWLARQQETQR